MNSVKNLSPFQEEAEDDKRYEVSDYQIKIAIANNTNFG